MRTKDLTKLSAKDICTLTGVKPGSRQLRRLLDAIKPNRSGIPGEIVEFSPADATKAVMLQQMYPAGVGEKLAAYVCSMIHRWVRVDLDKGLDAGFVLILRRVDGEAYLGRYIPRWDVGRMSEYLRKPAYFQSDDSALGGDWSSGKQVARALKEAGEEPTDPSVYELPTSERKNMVPGSFILFDLAAIFLDVMSRIERNSESLPELSIDQFLDAAVMASQVRDQVDSTEDTAKDTKEQ